MTIVKQILSHVGIQLHVGERAREVESELLMPIPSYQECMLPLLQAVKDGNEHKLKHVVPELAIRFRLTESEMEETLPSGPQPLFYNRVAWAQTYLVKAGLLERPQRGVFKITVRGKTVLKEQPSYWWAPLTDRCLHHSTCGG